MTSIQFGTVHGPYRYTGDAEKQKARLETRGLLVREFSEYKRPVHTRYLLTGKDVSAYDQALATNRMAVALQESGMNTVHRLRQVVQDRRGDWRSTLPPLRNAPPEVHAKVNELITSMERQIKATALQLNTMYAEQTAALVKKAKKS